MFFSKTSKSINWCTFDNSAKYDDIVCNNLNLSPDNYMYMYTFCMSMYAILQRKYSKTSFAYVQKYLENLSVEAL